MLTLGASAVATALAVAAVTPVAAAPVEPAATITASTPAPEVLYGAPIAVSGAVSEGGHPVPGAALELQADAYPFHGYAVIARAITAADGSFAFAALPADRNVRLRVVRTPAAAGAAASAVIHVYVDPRATLKSRSLGPGRTQLSLRLTHTTHGGGGSVEASWFVAARGTRVFRLLAVTPTRELRPGVTWVSAIVNPPARHFAYRVCLNPPWEGAMGRRAGHGRCPRGDYAVRHRVG